MAKYLNETGLGYLITKIKAFIRSSISDVDPSDAVGIDSPAYVTGDTHMLLIGEFTASSSTNNANIIITSSFWGGTQHGSSDIISYSCANNNNHSSTTATPIPYLAVSRTRLNTVSESVERKFYYQISGQDRFKLFVYVTGGIGYGSWSARNIGGKNGAKGNLIWQANAPAAPDTTPVTQTFTSGGYIAIPSTVGSTVSFTPVVNNSWSYSVFDVTPGQSFRITVKGGSSPRAWCFVDSDNKVLSLAIANYQYSNAYGIAPANAVKCIINNDNTTVASPSCTLANSAYEEIGYNYSKVAKSGIANKAENVGVTATNADTQMYINFTNNAGSNDSECLVRTTNAVTGRKLAYTSSSGILETGKQVDLYGTGSDNSVQVRVFKPNGSNSERMNFEYDSDGDRYIWDSVSDSYPFKFESGQTLARFTGILRQYDNEINFAMSPSATTRSDRVWFNYRDGDNFTSSNNTAITEYRFGNRNGTTNGVTLYADNFTGTAATATNYNTSTGTIKTALDGCVKTTGAQSIAGTKTFTANPIISASSYANLCLSTTSYNDIHIKNNLGRLLIEANGSAVISYDTTLSSYVFAGKMEWTHLLNAPNVHTNFISGTNSRTLTPGCTFTALTGVTDSNTSTPKFWETTYTLPSNVAVMFNYVGSDANTIYCI